MSAGSRIPFRARVVAPALLVTLVAVACSTPPSTESAPVRPTAPAASSAPELTPLTRSVQPFARPELDLGHRDPSIPTAGSIYFEPTPQQKADRDALLTAVQDPTSPSYHKWLTPADFAARFGARPADVTRVGEWLAQQGLTLDAPSPLGTRIGFRGTSGQIETAFRTEFHDYLVHGEKHYAMATAPMVPTEMAPVVMGLRGLHDFHPRPVYSGKRKPRPQFDDPTYGLEMGPSDFATLYDTASLLAASTPIDGAGVNIAIIGQTWITPSDLTGFFTQFGLTSHITNILVPGTGPQTVTQNDPPEAELDLEWSSAVGQGANILFVYVGGDQPNFSVNDSVVYVVEKGTTLAPGVGNGGAQIMSESYAGCDAYYAGTDADVDSEIAAAANLEGITYVAGSGDWGAATCWVDGIGGIYTGPPADMPGVTAVGGTEFCSGPSPNGVGCNYTGTTAPDVQKTPFFNTTTFTALEYPNTTLLTPSMGASQEGVWNDAVSDGQPSGGGGAPSVIFPKPAYQVGVTPSDGARDVPDVALTASVDNVGYEVYENGGLTPIGGTSAATPSFAGILAMVNQAVVAKGGPLGLGNANPMLYTLFQSNGTLGAFHDIVVGDNIMPCTVGTDPNCSTGSYGGYKASAGYDLASGLGTIDGAKLVAAWSGLAPTATTVAAAPTTVNVGQSVTLTADVGSAATTTAIGGTVTFTFETFAGSVGESYSDAGPAPADGGVQDESWVLGTVDVTALSNAPDAGSSEHATAQLTTAIPPGLYGKAYVVAMYNGDSKYLGSRSSPELVTVVGATLTIDPKAITLAPFGTTTFTTSGGAPPVTWGIIGTDSTCNASYQCSQVTAETTTKAFFQAGATAGGTVHVIAIDTNGEEAVATVTVTASGTPLDAGTFPTFDAGAAGGPGNPPTTPFDGGVYDAGETEDAGADGGTEVDAGHEADSGTADAGHEVDSGSEGTDSGTTTDSGSGSNDAGEDSGGSSTSSSSGSSGGTTSSGSSSGTASSGGSSGASSGSTSSGSSSGSSSGATEEDGGEDGGTTSGTGSSNGCSCVVAGSNGGNGGENGGAALGGVLLGLAAIGRRRSRRA